LPRRTGERGGDGVLEAAVGVGDHELHAGQATGHEATQEGRPARSVLAGHDVDAQDLPLAVGVHGRGDDGRHVDDPASFPAALRECVKPHVGVGPLVERPVAERLHLLVERRRQPRHLGLGDALDAERLDEVIHPAGGDAEQVALGDHGHQGTLGPATGLEQPVREVGAGPQLRDAQLDRAGPGVPVPLPVAVARVGALAAPLAVGGAAHRRGLGVHQGVHEHREHAPQQIDVGVLELLAKPGQRLHRGGDHRVLLLILEDLEDGTVVLLFYGFRTARTPRPGTLLPGSLTRRSARATHPADTAKFP
jgi:hypothetical protein